MSEHLLNKLAEEITAIRYRCWRKDPSMKRGHFNRKVWNTENHKLREKRGIDMVLWHKANDLSWERCKNEKRL